MPRRRRDSDEEMPELPRLSDIQDAVQEILNRGGTSLPLQIDYEVRATDVQWGPLRHRIRKLTLRIHSGSRFWSKMKRIAGRGLILVSRFLPIGRKLIGKGS